MTASDMIMSVWEPWLSMLVCHALDLIPTKSTFLFLIQQPGTDPGIRYRQEEKCGSDYKRNAYKFFYGKCLSRWCSDSFHVCLKSTITLFHKYSEAWYWYFDLYAYLSSANCLYCFAVVDSILLLVLMSAHTGLIGSCSCLVFALMC